MSQAEYAAWIEFYKLYPFDDLHRHHRPAVLVARSIAGGDVQQMLDWLQPPDMPEGLSLADYNTLKALGIQNNQSEG